MVTCLYVYLICSRLIKNAQWFKTFNNWKVSKLPKPENHDIIPNSLKLYELFVSRYILPVSELLQPLFRPYLCTFPFMSEYIFLKDIVKGTVNIILIDPQFIDSQRYPLKLCLMKKECFCFWKMFISIKWFLCKSDLRILASEPICKRNKQYTPFKPSITP